MDAFPLLAACSLGRIILSTQNGYIHPDEHFQGSSIVQAYLTGQDSDIPWEFTSENPARSLTPIFMVYYPFFKLLNGYLEPLAILHCIRLFFCLISWVFLDAVLLPNFYTTSRKNNQLRVLMYTSYVIMVYQNHTFSNSIETWLLIACLVYIDKLRVMFKASMKDMFALSLLLVVGAFNRVTFPCFVIFPMASVMPYFWRNKLHLVYLAVFSAGFAYLFIQADSMLYLLLSGVTLVSYNSPVIAPLNNLVYNSKVENLAEHGLHPRFTHITANLGQMLGPLYLVMLVNIKDYLGYVKIRYSEWRKPTKKPETSPKFHAFWDQNILYLAILSGLFFLSLFPHQELRFLLPLQPLVLHILDFEFLHEKLTGKKGELWYVVTGRSKIVLRNILVVWGIFNAIFGVLMGVFHQGGVLTALEYLQNSHENEIHIWWRTYLPPGWILDRPFQKSTLEQPQLEANKTVIVDAMGGDLDRVMKVLKQSLEMNKPTKLICPKGSFNGAIEKSNHSLYFEPEWALIWHLDMDHLERGFLEPGIGVYLVQKAAN